MFARRWWPVVLAAVGVAALLVFGSVSEPAGDLARYLFVALVATTVVLGVAGAVAARLAGRQSGATPRGGRDGGFSRGGGAG